MNKCEICGKKCQKSIKVCEKCEKDFKLGNKNNFWYSFKWVFEVDTGVPWN